MPLLTIMPLGTLGKYERLDVLGHGVSGIVYLAKDTLLNKQVALKEVDVQAGDMRRFLEEARVMDRLRHPNIVRVNSVDRIDGKIVIDMEYVRGHNLQDLLRSEGCLPLDRALSVTEQVLDALGYAHRMQTVHRDIKPANVLIGNDGVVKLVDFGLAEILATNSYAGGAGTYAYMAPEDFAEEDRSDHQSDIWAVGITLFEMLTAHRPFQVAKAKDPFAWKRALETELPERLSDYLPDAPPGVQRVLDRALARDKDHRYQTAEEFRADVLRLYAASRPGIPSLGSREPTANGDGDTRPLTRAPERTAPPERLPSPQSWPAAQTPADGLYARTRPELEIAEEEKTRVASRIRLPFFGRKSGVGTLVVEPDTVDLGSVHKGDFSSARITARVVGGQGLVAGRVEHNAPWLTVHPEAFDRARQTITLTAHSSRAWETGEFHETVRIETAAGSEEVRVRLVVLQPRPSFVQIAVWWVPLLVIALGPALVTALGPAASQSAALRENIVPASAVASGMMALMLLLIGVAANVGKGEKLVCGMLATVMCLVLGVWTAAMPHAGMQDATAAGIGLGCVLLLQLLNLSRWKFWAVGLACIGLAISGVFLHKLMP